MLIFLYRSLDGLDLSKQNESTDRVHTSVRWRLLEDRK
jgi:hypothetical protein